MASFSTLPDLTMELVTSYLCPSETIVAGSTCRTVRDIVFGSDALWSRHCASLFVTKYNCPPLRKGLLPLHWNTRLAPDQLGLLSVRQLRAFMLLLKVPQAEIASFVEKSEMRRRVVDKQAEMDSQLRNGLFSLLPVPHSCPSYMSYVGAIADSKRLEILSQELCSFPFGMFFKNVQAGLHVQQGRYSECFHTTHTFHPDGSMTSDDPNVDNHQRTWRFARVDGPSLQNKASAIEHSTIGIRIEPFPILRVSRTPSWGWLLENEHVVMFQEVTHCSGVDSHFEEGWSKMPISYELAMKEKEKEKRSSAVWGQAE
mmetsp:Transcript_17190/g.34438  ORF Transcript_17190/g.34438 Transcript_17190/m.34438 type:complete len:314 (-) Transcript_17190:87-1028(-)